jgi:hypothetical protein
MWETIAYHRLLYLIYVATRGDDTLPFSHTHVHVLDHAIRSPFSKWISLTLLREDGPNPMIMHVNA